MAISARKKLVLFPPIQTFPTNIVSIAAGGITAASIAPGAFTAAKFGAGALAGQLIKSIQYGTVVIPDTLQTGVALITAVDITKAALMYLGNDGLDTLNAGRSNFDRVTLTDATHVTANRAFNTGIGNVNFVVVEYF